MAAPLSIEENINAFFVETIKTIEADISTPPESVHDFLLDYAAPEQFEDYLLQDLQSDAIRAIGVMTTATEEPSAEGGSLDSLIVRRTYRVRIQMYYDAGVNGEGIHQVIADARKVRKAIYDAGSNLKKLVNIFVGMSGPQLSTIDPLSSTAGRIIVAEMVFEYQRIRPDF